MNVLDLFCGAGGLSYGFAQHHQVVCAVDNDADALRSYRSNHVDTIVAKYPIEKLEFVRVSDRAMQLCIPGKAPWLLTLPDIVVGGPPCQGFSMAGKRFFNDPRNNLVSEFCRVVNALEPPYFLMENVKGLQINHGAVFIKQLHEKLPQYDIDVREFNAADFGVPQKRRRVFVQGTTRGKEHISWPKPTHKGSWVPSSSVINAPNDGHHLVFVMNSFKTTSNAPHYFLNEPAKTVTTRPQHLYQTGDWKVTHDISWKTIKERGYHENFTKVRDLTVAEQAALQGFPDHYIFHGGKQSQLKQVGNAVPPSLAMAIASMFK